MASEMEKKHLDRGLEFCLCPLYDLGQVFHSKFEGIIFQLGYLTLKLVLKWKAFIETMCTRCLLWCALYSAPLQGQLC